MINYGEKYKKYKKDIINIYYYFKNRLLLQMFI